MDDPPGNILLVILSGLTLINVLTLLSIVVLLFVSGLVSASEVAFFSLKSEDIDKCRDKGDSISLAIVELLSRPRLLLATILILNNLVNVAIVTISTFFMWEMTGTHNPGKVIVGVVTFSATFVITFFGEILPKVYATRYNVTFARVMAIAWKLMVGLCRPVSLPMLKISSVVERRFKRKGYHTTVEELNQALDIAADNDETTKDEKDILRGIVNFGTLTVPQIMCSRIDVSAVDVEMNFHQLMDYINKSGFSRLPAYRETIDRIEGILYVKDLLPFIEQDESFQWQKLLRSGFFVPETKKVDALLKDFQAKHVHMALVVDEYGGTSGLITLEDIIEEIIGEINDEFDEESINFEKISDDTFVFEGKISLHDFSKVLEIPEDRFEEVRGESESLGGLLLELHRQLPKAGQQIEFKEFHFTVEAADRRRIKRVRVVIQPDHKPEP